MTIDVRLRSNMLKILVKKHFVYTHLTPFLRHSFFGAFALISDIEFSQRAVSYIYVSVCWCMCVCVSICVCVCVCISVWMERSGSGGQFISEVEFWVIVFQEAIFLGSSFPGASFPGDYFLRAVF